MPSLAEVSEACNDFIEYLIVRADFVSSKAYRTIVDVGGLAHSLVSQKLIDSNQFDQIMKTASWALKSRCSLGQALESLRNYRIAGVKPEDTMRRQYGISLDGPKPLLGEMLGRSGVLSRSELLPILEQSLRNNRPLGEELISEERVPEAVVEMCLQLQRFVGCGVLNETAAIAALGTCLENQWSLLGYFIRTQILSEDATQAMALVDLLKQAGLITQDDILSVLLLTTDFCIGPIAALAVCGKISPQIYQAALGCYKLVECKRLTGANAVLALRWCHQRGLGVDRALPHVLELSLSDAQEQAIPA